MNKDELMDRSYHSLHNHTAMGSNNRFLDSMNDVEKLLDSAFEKGLRGISISDHQALSAHIKAQKYLKANMDRFNDFRVTYGDEIYLVDMNKVNKDVEAKLPTKFFHFLLTAKNDNGYNLLRQLSSKAWGDSFFYRGMRRLPTDINWLESIMDNYRGDVIGSTACLGSELSNLILKYDTNKSIENKRAVTSLIYRLKNIFGEEDFYFELMPSHNREQEVVNNYLIKLSSECGVKYIITTDSHYTDKNDEDIHETFLKSENVERNVKDFYEYAHLFTSKELAQYFPFNVLQEAFTNSLNILDKVDDIDFKNVQTIPVSPIPAFDRIDLRNYKGIDWGKYPVIQWYANESQEIADRYYIYQIFNGAHNKKQKMTNENLSRINTELNVVKTISDYLGAPLSQYFLTTQRLIDIMWESGSLVGPGRGSVGCFYTAYLLDITKVNAIEHNLPYWRFLSEERKDDMPDVDLDSEGSQRKRIIEQLKDYYGNDHVLNFCTFNTQAAKSTILTACRGLGIDRTNSQNLVDLLPSDRMVSWSIHDSIFGNPKKGRKPNEMFIEAIEKYPKLKETILEIEGQVRGVSQHASGVAITNDSYTNSNAMMLTQSGLEVTQFDAHDSEYAGDLKYDVLTLNALDRIHEAIRLLLKDGKIQWQGSLRRTYDYYFDVDKLEMKAPKMFDMLFSGDVINAFEFNTIVGRNTLEKMNARTFDELVAANALMRLTIENGEQPIDRYLRYRSDIQQWYNDMNEYGLSENEIEIMKTHLSKFYGVCYSQESLMSISMDKRITGFGLLEANKLRKSIAKKNNKLYEQEREHFFKAGNKLGTSDALLNYVWDMCAEPAKFYSFNLAHGTTYTMILMVEMNICYRYGSIYWKTACLSVNSGIYGNKFENTDYATLAKAISEMPGQVHQPSINASDYGFTVNRNNILYGLYPIIGISKDDVDVIMETRPFNSVIECFERTKLSNKKMVSLIKAGAFDEFKHDRRQIMIDFVSYINPNKKKLTTVQLGKVRNAVPETLAPLLSIYDFRNTITGRNAVKMNQNIETEFFNKYERSITEKYGKSYEYVDGVLSIDLKKFDKWYKKQILPITDWLKTDEAIKEESSYRKKLFWKDNCLGNVSSWEMESLSFYANIHELQLTDISKSVPVTNFNDIDKTPIIIDYSEYRGKKYPIYEHSIIYGTVIDKETSKNMIYLLTPDGVANIRLGERRFVKYNKKISHGSGKNRQLIEDSWLNRGSKLVCIGFRRGKDFILNKKRTGYDHTIMKVVGYGKSATIEKEKQ